jgi:hypothetical protein
MTASVMFGAGLEKVQQVNSSVFDVAGGEAAPYFRAHTMFWPDRGEAYVVTGKQVGINHLDAICGESPKDATSNDFVLLTMIEGWVQLVNAHADGCGGDVVAVMPWPLYLDSGAQSVRHKEVEIRLMPLFQGRLEVFLQVHPGWEYSLRLRAVGELGTVLDKLDVGTGGTVVAFCFPRHIAGEKSYEVTTRRVTNFDLITGLVDTVVELSDMELHPSRYTALV